MLVGVSSLAGLFPVNKYTKKKKKKKILSQYRLVTCHVCPPCSAAVRGVLVRSWWVAGGEGVTEMEGEGVEGWR